MEHISTSPIFLLGAARSGTKFTRSILAASSQVAAIPYDVNYIWRMGQERTPHDELDPADLTPKIRTQIHRQLARLAGLAKDDKRILVEKTVSNTLRVPYIEALYPGARYIHLIRDGRAVTESAMRLWQAPPDTGSLLKKLKQIPLSSIGYVVWFGFNFARGLVTGRGGGEVWGPRYKGLSQDMAEKRPLVEICARQWQRSVQKALQDLQNIPSERVFTLRYEDLVGNEERIKKLIAFAGLGDQEKVLAYYRANVRKGNDDKWKERLAENEVSTMMKLIAPTLEELGFSDTTENSQNQKGSA